MKALELSGRQEPLPSIGDMDTMSPSLWYDWQIRHVTMLAVRHDDATVEEITSELQSQKEVVLLHEIILQRPFHMPPVVVDTNSEDLGTDNIIMREFVFDVFDVLSDHFGEEVWGEWCIAPYFTEQDDIRNSFCLGVFAEAVVE